MFFRQFARSINTRNSCLLSKATNTDKCCALRPYSTKPKRFYKYTGILNSDGQYEITLDQRKLKTPKGNVLKLENELLAMAVAAEWDGQKDSIERSNMHLTSLCNTAQDNPNFITKTEAAESIFSFLETDTILYHSNNEEVYEIQKKEWLPVISWFKERYKVDIAGTRNLEGPQISSETKTVLLNHILTFSLPSLHGFLLAVESLKSLILTLSCIDKRLTTNQAVLLSRLEEEFQADRWGRVEWSHNVSQYDVQARVAAAVLFIHLNSMEESTKSKLVSCFK
ncbi:ATP synthase mitochondrial F1 complex assembly factor 2 isoform X1 [Cimex lectularius]|uniref:ATP synthase mitochondrial F1 complex assembly factor 2 n=1 Tax=Cimex lectularius TaxID=79782 RepID=A0A8I6SJ26_CIMLE|nr:ATP synthase mitochondrial F1 complex assembly factor 2 isoform X1 [Cimex lectularius]